MALITGGTKETGPDAWRRAAPPASSAAEDVANAALFLSAPSGRYVTGIVLPVDGGLGAHTRVRKSPLPIPNEGELASQLGYVGSDGEAAVGSLLNSSRTQGA